MNFEWMILMALEEGFEQAEVIETDKLVFRPEFRVLCEMNDCGNYGNNYGCPPSCGTVEEMQNKVCRYRYALVMQSSTPVDDVMDQQLMKQLKKQHNKRGMKLIARLHAKMGGERGTTVMAGPCTLCENCKMQTGEPCAHEELRFSCMSAFCIDINQLAQQCGMEINWMGNPVSFFGIYCFEPRS